jgi:phosphonate degradation associated HDIG domain protein
MRSAAVIERHADQALDPLRRSAELDYIGEPVSQLQHALQAAALALQSGQSDAVVIAALFHDIGHLLDPQAEQMAGLGVVDHERLGAEFLREHGFSESVAHLVESHVNAKRYLCYRKAGYLGQLSQASRQTLEWQGGPMGQAEAEAFENDPWFEAILTLRVYDERAKSVEVDVPPIEQYRSTIIQHLYEQSEGVRDVQRAD